MDWPSASMLYQQAVSYSSLQYLLQKRPVFRDVPTFDIDVLLVHPVFIKRFMRLAVIISC